MVTTLRSILAMEPLRGAKPEILAGHDHLDRPVRWVHVAEVGDLHDLLAGHEVVLTTGLPLTGSGADPERFIRQLAASNSCGLVVELNPLLPAIPLSVVAAAERHHLPVVALHSSVRFVAVTETVHRLIIGEHYAGLEFAQRTHEVFTALSVDSADTATIVEQVSALIDAPVVLEDIGHRAVAVARRGLSVEHLLDAWEERSRHTPSPEAAGPSGPDEWLVCPVGLRGAPWGRLVAPQRSNDPKRDAMALQRAAQALQISRLVERDRAGMHTQAQESLLLELVDGRMRDEQEAAARARALGIGLARRYVPVVVLFEGPVTEDQIARQHRARGHLDIVSGAMTQVRVQGMVGGLVDDGVGILLPLSSQPDEDRSLAELAKALHSSTPGSLVVGVGRPADSLVTAAAHLRSTVNVAQAARALPPSSLPYFRSTDVRLRGLLAQLHDDERVLAFMESELAPILALGSDPDSDLLRLLRAFVDLRGNKAAVAQAVGISRPALYGRLAKLERVLSVDLDDAESLLSLSVALLVQDSRTASRSLRSM